jgi:hypothetical protein
MGSVPGSHSSHTPPLSPSHPPPDLPLLILSRLICFVLSTVLPTLNTSSTIASTAWAGSGATRHSASTWSTNDLVGLSTAVRSFFRKSGRCVSDHSVSFPDMVVCYVCHRLGWFVKGEGQKKGGGVVTSHDSDFTACNLGKRNPGAHCKTWGCIINPHSHTSCPRVLAWS